MQSAGFIGLGAMGAPMAKRIVSAGFDLSVFDVRPENTEPLVELGARRAGSLREVAEGAEALVLMVVNAEQVVEVLFGGEGAAEVPVAGICRCGHEHRRTRGGAAGSVDDSGVRAGVFERTERTGRTGDSLQI